MGCRKKPYNTKREAKSRARVLNLTRGVDNFHAYRCPLEGCDFWHVGRPGCRAATRERTRIVRRVLGLS